jgi:hypothetical protein
MTFKKIILSMVGTAILSAVFSQVGMAQIASDATKKTAGVQSDPDTFFWLFGIGLIILFVFMIVLALGKATIALSENIGKNYHS